MAQTKRLLCDTLTDRPTKQKSRPVEMRSTGPKDRLAACKFFTKEHRESCFDLRRGGNNISSSPGGVTASLGFFLHFCRLSSWTLPWKRKKYHQTLSSWSKETFATIKKCIRIIILISWFLWKSPWNIRAYWVKLHFENVIFQVDNE